MARQNAAQKKHLHLHSVEKPAPHIALIQALNKEHDELDARIQIIQNLAAERDQAVEQVNAIRELAERSMADAEQRADELSKTKLQLSLKESKVRELEATVKQQSERLAQLENTLKMLAEADENS